MFEEILLDQLEKFHLDAPVYLFMPNHVHLITSGKSEESDCLGFMKSFKQRTGYWLAGNMNQYVWQKDFYDHIIRNDEDIRNQIYYILRNPIRAEIVSHWKNYSYKGSTVFNLNEFEY